jgi:hypothetical protein
VEWVSTYFPADFFVQIMPPNIFPKVADRDLDGSTYFGKLDKIQNSKFRSFIGSKWSCRGPWTLTMEAWRNKMESWMVYRPVIANDDPDPDADQDHISVNSGIHPH